MARLFYGINRALRCNFNFHNRPSQQSLLHEEEPCSTYVSNTRNNRHPRCTREHVNQLYKRACYLQGINSGYAGGRYYGNHRGYGKHGFHRCFYEYLHNHGIHFETVAWGAVVMLSFHLPKLWKRESHIHETCLWHDVKQIVSNIKAKSYSLPAIHGESTESVLSGHSGGNFNYKLLARLLDNERNKETKEDNQEKTKFPEKVDFIISDDYIGPADQSSQSEESSDEQTDKSTDNENSEPSARSELDKACQEWRLLSDKYVKLQRNHTAYMTAQRGKEKDAFNLWSESVETNDPTACYNVALCYHNGYAEMSPDILKAVHYYKKAAAQGHARSLYNLGVLHLGGEGGLEKSVELATQCFHEAAQSGLAPAQKELAVIYAKREPKEMEEAVKWFKKAAHQKDTESLYYLGVCYEHGMGVPSDIMRALQLYTESARDGNSSALYSLGGFHEHGLAGLPENATYAMELYQKAADSDHYGAEQAVERLGKLQQNTTDFSDESFYTTDDDDDLPMTRVMVQA